MDDSRCGRGTWTPQESIARSVSLAVMMISPGFLLLLFMITTTVHAIVTANREAELVVPSVRGPGGKLLPITKRKRKAVPGPATTKYRSFSTTARRFFQYASALIVVTFGLDGAAIALHAYRDHEPTGIITEGWWPGSPPVVYTLGSFFLYLYFLLTLVDWKSSPVLVHSVAWSAGLAFELALVVCCTTGAAVPHCVQERTHFFVRKSPTHWELISIVIGSVRVSVIIGMVCVYICTNYQPHTSGAYPSRNESTERTPLLSEIHSPIDGRASRENGHPNSSGLASTTAQPKAPGQSGTAGSTRDSPPGFGRDADAAFYRPEKLPHKSWYEYVSSYGLFFPYLWPKGKPGLQFLVLLCFLIMVVQRLINVLVPLQLGAVITALEERRNGAGGMPWEELGWFGIYKLLQGPSALLGSIRSLLWIPVSQNSYRALTTASFEHVHSLSLDFHLGKRTGEVLSALNKGAAINSFMEQVTFQVFPMLFDLFFAVTYFYTYFNVIYAELVAIITFYYLLITIRMAAARADQRRDMVNADREEEAVKNDSITSYETVKYFNAERFEFKRYSNAIDTFQAFEVKYLLGMNVMNVCQSLVFICGLMVTAMLGAWEVAYKFRDIGEFVTLLTYLQQLQGPLNFFGTFYRTVQQAMISAERLLELFKVQPTVVDDAGVRPLQSCTGHIRFDGVKFAYDKKRGALQDLSFECLPGTTTAFVGESGGGKSTVFRLMYRYYNSQAGKIEIDGQDVRRLTIDSVRRNIGVVPQDTILFNETLRYNLRYANQDASDEDIESACRAARIHDRITAFSDGYDTKVGERGLRLSGGEKQRVAIARIFLKNPKILMLDEATSALDSSTEQQIQQELDDMAEGRTLLIIA